MMYQYLLLYFELCLNFILHFFKQNLYEFEFGKCGNQIKSKSNLLNPASSIKNSMSRLLYSGPSFSFYTNKLCTAIVRLEVDGGTIIAHSI